MSLLNYLRNTKRRSGLMDTQYKNVPVTGTNVKGEVTGMERIVVELFKGRHKFEDIEGCIFNRELRDVKNMYYMQMSIKKAVDALMKRHGIREYRDIELDVYVTGLTVALVEVINFCSLYDIKLVLYHYDKYTKNYYTQDVYLKRQQYV